MAGRPRNRREPGRYTQSVMGAEARKAAARRAKFYGNERAREGMLRKASGELAEMKERIEEGLGAQLTPFQLQGIVADALLNRTKYIQHLMAYMDAADPASEEGLRKLEYLIKHQPPSKYMPNLGAQTLLTKDLTDTEPDPEEMTDEEIEAELERIRAERASVEEQVRIAGGTEIAFEMKKGERVEEPAEPPSPPEAFPDGEE